MPSTTIQKFTTKAEAIASRYTGEERNILETHAMNLEKRLE